MGNERTCRILRQGHEILLCLTLAFAVISILFIQWPQCEKPFIDMEVSIKQLLHIRQTDLITGYFEFSIASVILALFLWTFLRLFSRARFMLEFLRSLAGFVIFLALPLFWFYLACRDGRLLEWPFTGLLLEIAGVLVLVTIFVSRQLSIPPWAGLFFIAMHFAIWFWIRGNYQLANYAGPIGPVLGFCSGAVWFLFVLRTRQEAA